MSTQKIYVSLDGSKATRENETSSWKVDVTLWGITNSITVIAYDKPEKKVSKAGNDYFVGGQIIVPNMSSSIPLFYSTQFNYSNAKIGEGDDEIKISLYNAEDSLKSARGNSSKSDAKSYKLLFKYEEKVSSDKEFDFGTGEDITPQLTQPVSKPQEDISELPF